MYTYVCSVVPTLFPACIGLQAMKQQLQAAAAGQRQLTVVGE